MQTKVYRQQHLEMRRMLEDMNSTLTAEKAEEARSGLARLAGILKVHLAMEDRSLYPRMLVHEDAEVRGMAAQYQQEMGEISALFAAFYEKWRRQGAIEAQTREFADAYRKFSQTLTARMDREDGNLYPLVDEQVNLAS